MPAHNGFGRDQEGPAEPARTQPAEQRQQPRGSRAGRRAASLGVAGWPTGDGARRSRNDLPNQVDRRLDAVSLGAPPPDRPHTAPTNPRRATLRKQRAIARAFWPAHEAGSPRRRSSYCTLRYSDEVLGTDTTSILVPPHLRSGKPVGGKSASRSPESTTAPSSVPDRNVPGVAREGFTLSAAPARH
jgi:hypothetical protein